MKTNKPLQEKHVVTCFLESDGKVLILRRSTKVGSYQGRWAGVSGYIESSPDKQALTELSEEVGLSGDNIKLIKRGETVAAEDEKLGTRWVVHPYLFHVINPTKIRIDWEHKESKWIDPKDITNYETVPKLKEALDAVMS